MARETLAKRIRRDLTQIEILLECGQLTKQALTDLLRSLKEEATEVEDLIWSIEIAEAAPPAGKDAAFAALRARFQKMPGVDRMELRGHLGVITGGRA